MGEYHRPLVALALIAVLVVGFGGSSVAHETRSVEGYDFTFGGADEPLVTGERTWLELEIVNNETGESVANQSETLNVSVQKPGYQRKSLEVGEVRGEPGVYRMPVIFTEPGDYVVHVRGSVEETEVHTHFETAVRDRANLTYPSPEFEVDTGQANRTG